MQIFVSRNNQKHGPYSLDDIKMYLTSGHLSGSDMAWFQGASDWMPLSQIPGVQMPPGSIPPPPPTQVAGASSRVSIRQEEMERMNARVSWYYGRQLQGCVVGTLVVCGLFYWLLHGLSSWVSSSPSQQTSTNSQEVDVTEQFSKAMGINENKDKRKKYEVPTKLDASDVVTVFGTKDGLSSKSSYRDFCAFNSTDSTGFIDLVRRAKKQQAKMKGGKLFFSLLPRRVDSSGNILPHDDRVVELRAQENDTPLEMYKSFVNEADNFRRSSGRK